MRWFKHFTDLRRDPAIRKVERKLGEAGYARAVKVSELIAQHGGSGAQFVPRIDLNDPATDMEWLSDELGIKTKEAERTVKVLADSGWLEKKPSTKGILSRPGMLHERDAYSERQQQKNPPGSDSRQTTDKGGSDSRQTTDKVGRATAQKQRERERESSSASQSSKSASSRPATQEAKPAGRSKSAGKILKELSETIGGGNGTSAQLHKHLLDGITRNRVLNCFDDSINGKLSLGETSKGMLRVALTHLILNRGFKELRGVTEEQIRVVALPAVQSGLPVIEALTDYKTRKNQLTGHVLNCVVNAAIKLRGERHAD